MTSVSSALSHSNWFLSDDRALYSFGYNEYGQLGLGNTTNTLSPELVTSLASMAVKKVVAGFKHTAIIADDGQLYTFGDNSKGQLGTGNLQSRPRPQVVSVGEKIVDVAVGSEHTVAVTASGAVFAWGSNELGQLGQSSGASAQSTTPLRVSALAKKTIVGVSCGYEHVIVLSSDGQVFAWGNNHAGQLGISNILNQDSPQIVSTFGLKTITKIVCGYAQSFFLTDEGELYGTGLNQKGQLGLGHTNTPIVTPAKVPVGGAVTDFGVGNGSVIGVLDSGTVFGFGLNGYGELGAKLGPKAESPTELTWAKSMNVSSIFLGWSHLIVSTKSGLMYAGGRGDFGQLGVKKQFSKDLLQMTLDKKFTFAASMDSASSVQQGVKDLTIEEEAFTLAAPERESKFVTFTSVAKNDDILAPGHSTSSS